MDTILQNYLKEIQKLKKQQNIYLVIFILITALFIYSIYNYFQTKQIILLIICIFAYVGLAILNERINQKKQYYHQRVEVIHLYKNKKNRKIDDLDNGLQYPHAISLEDLDIVGTHSLFQYMNMARSIQGKNKLIQRFENTNHDIEKYHEAIQDIKNQKEFIISYISSIQENIDFESTVSFMQMESQKVNIVLVFDFLLDIAVLISGILELFGLFPRYTFIYTLSFHYLFSFIYASYYGRYFKKLPQSIRNLSHLEYSMDIDTNSELLKNIKENLIESQKAFKSIKRLETLYAYEQNIFSSILLNALASLKPMIILQVNHLLSYDLKKYTESLSDLEVIISLATPVILEEKVVQPLADPKLVIEEGCHPLITNCVGNSFIENKKVCIITGSNMSGKTSFLRMIGVNMTLMNAGSYVFASSFHAPISKIYTSMRIRDDLQHGISTFYGELLRIKEALDDSSIKIILIDEIFKGTNYQDRITGALQVIQSLQIQSALTFITTHDFQLCDQKDVDNYYFKEEYKEDEIYFDYLIHPGKNTSSNALFLMKKAGIIKGCEENETIKDKME